MVARKRSPLSMQSSPRRRRRAALSMRYIYKSCCARLRKLRNKIKPRKHIFHLLCSVHKNCRYVRNLEGTVKGHFNPKLLEFFWTHKNADNSHTTWRPVKNGIKIQWLVEIYNDRKMPEEVMELATSIYHQNYCCRPSVPLPTDSMNDEEKLASMTAVAFSDRSDAYYEELRTLQFKVNGGKPLFIQKSDTFSSSKSPYMTSNTRTLHTASISISPNEASSSKPPVVLSNTIEDDSETIYEFEEEGLEPFPDFYGNTPTTPEPRGREMFIR